MSLSTTQEQLRTTLGKRLREARATTDDLFDLLDPNAITARPISERNRIVFYLGHFEAFDWNLLGKSTFGLDAFNKDFDHLFAFGIDPVDGDLPTDLASDWPSVSEIRAYNERVRLTVDRLLEDAMLDRSADSDHRTAFNVAIEHRLMHAETLTYMIHWLPLDSKKKFAGSDNGSEDARPVEARVARIPAGTATLGLPRDSGQFGWDNEFEQVEIDVPTFEIDVFNVTNGQYLEFVRSGGYEERTLWRSDDWDWISSNQIRHPRFWESRTDHWLQRTMFDVRPLPASWPVYVSQAEAAAYARWLGKTLPTEAQIHRAAYGTARGEERPYPWGTASPGRHFGNFDFHRWDPVPVGSFPLGTSAFGISDLVGNGWEWTSTVFGPFEGFERFEFYPEYSANFFEGKHYVVKGGSSRTSACMLRRSFRNWFQPNYPHIYATFRCVNR